MSKSTGSYKALTASFIVTVATAMGCSAAQPESEMTHNPPMPTTTPSVVIATATPVTEPTTVVAEPEPPAPPELPAAPTDRAGRVYRSGDKCEWIADSGPVHCPPGTKCNPPRPETISVKCPTVDPNLPAAPADAVVQTRSDGTCFYLESPGWAKRCPPGMRCNPPPPKRHDVRCPED